MKQLFLLTALLMLLVAGCGGAPSLDEPPQIAYGEQECDHCRMLISDARYAAAYMTEAGEARRFDDIGDMLLYHSEHEEDVYLFWVHDFDSKTWVKADEAFFVVSDAITSPMGHGIAAHNSREAAEAMATSLDGSVVTFAQLMDQAKAGELAPAHQSEHNHSG
jgi:copper chaperone NosL